MKTCSVDGCSQAHAAKGYCSFHYQRKRDGSEMLSPRAYRKPQASRECSVTGCQRRHLAKGYCKQHYRRKKDGKDLTAPLRFRNMSGAWYNNNGYLMVVKDGKAIRQHRFIMEQHLGRQLLSTENVHHKNTIRSDNSLHNLELWVRHQPTGGRLTDIYAYAERIIELYKDEIMLHRALEIDENTEDKQ